MEMKEKLIPKNQNLQKLHLLNKLPRHLPTKMIHKQPPLLPPLIVQPHPLPTLPPTALQPPLPQLTLKVTTTTPLLKPQTLLTAPIRTFKWQVSCPHWLLMHLQTPKTANQTQTRLLLLKTKFLLKQLRSSDDLLRRARSDVLSASF